MLKSELIALIDGVEDNASVESILKDTDLIKSNLTIDNFKELVATNNDFKSFMDSEKDKHFSKSHETWKQNHMQSLIEAEIAKRNPNKSPQEIEMDKLRNEIETIKAEKAKAELVSKYKDVFAEKRIPSQLHNFLLNSNEEEVINANIAIFEESMKAYVENGINDRLRDNEPPKNNGARSGILDKTAFSKMTYLERVKLMQENPELYNELNK